MNRRGFIAALAGLAALAGCRSAPKVSGTITLPPGLTTGTTFIFYPTRQNTGAVRVNGLRIVPASRCTIERTKRGWRVKA
jgi:hypothetical protein